MGVVAKVLKGNCDNFWPMLFIDYYTPVLYLKINFSPWYKPLKLEFFFLPSCCWHGRQWCYERRENSKSFQANFVMCLLELQYYHVDGLIVYLHETNSHSSIHLLPTKHVLYGIAEPLRDFIIFSNCFIVSRSWELWQNNHALSPRVWNAFRMS